jgi:hypothetical protein
LKKDVDFWSPIPYIKHSTRKEIEMSKYTEVHVNAIREMAPMDLEKAKALAETGPFVEAGITAKGIVSKCRNLGVQYNPVQRTTKTGQPVQRKNEVVERIETFLGVEDGTFASAAKMNKQELQLLFETISAFEPRH